MNALIVTHAFGDYKPGDVITDPALIERFKGSPNVAPTVVPPAA